MWFLCHCNLFSSALRNSREHNHNTFTRPWVEEYIQTWKNAIFLHTSVVLSSPGWRRQEMGMTASCLCRLWRQATRNDVTAEQCSWAFTRLFVMCDLQLPPLLFHLWFSVSRSDGYRLPYMSALFLQDSMWKRKKKEKWHRRASGHDRDLAYQRFKKTGVQTLIYLIIIEENNPNFKHHNHHWWKWYSDHVLKWKYQYSNVKSTSKSPAFQNPICVWKYWSYGK